MFLSVRKYPFFYRNQQQYENVVKFARQVSDDITKANGGRSYVLESSVQVKSPQWTINPIRMKMPKEKIGKKKYIGTLSIPQRHVELLDYDVSERLLELGVELVQSQPNKPRYTEDQLIRATVHIKTVPQFRKITSILNKKYGHGNWHFRQCKNILKKLRKMENVDMARSRRFFNYSSVPQLPNDEATKNGLKVDVVVINTTDNAENLERYLFQAQLMS